MKKPTLLCLAVITGILAAEPVSKPDQLASAHAAVATQISARLSPPSLPPFSRAMPRRPIPIYQAVELVDNEKRLPFTIAMGGRQASVSGYVRLSDDAIFIFRPEKKDHIRSTLDPRFAPKEEPRPDPKKPA